MMSDAQTPPLPDSPGIDIQASQPGDPLTADGAEIEPRRSPRDQADHNRRPDHREADTDRERQFGPHVSIVPYSEGSVYDSDADCRARADVERGVALRMPPPETVCYPP